MICNIISNPAPGKPNNPINIEVTTFRPMWNPKFAPITFIANISIPPKIEFNINFIIFFRGNINIFPKMNKKIMQAP